MYACAHMCDWCQSPEEGVRATGTGITVVSCHVGYCYYRTIKILLCLKAWPELSVIPHWQLGKT